LPQYQWPLYWVPVPHHHQTLRSQMPFPSPHHTG
jgi:hypothetical protein